MRKIKRPVRRVRRERCRRNVRDRRVGLREKVEKETVGETINFRVRYRENIGKCQTQRKSAAQISNWIQQITRRVRDRDILIPGPGEIYRYRPPRYHYRGTCPAISFLINMAAESSRRSGPAHPNSAAIKTWRPIRSSVPDRIAPNKTFWFFQSICRGQ